MATHLFDLLGKVDNLDEPIPPLNRRPVAYGLIISFLVSPRPQMSLSSLMRQTHSLFLVLKLRNHRLVHWRALLHVYGSASV